MNINISIGIALIIPFLGTIIGSSMVFLGKNKENMVLQKFFLGFSAGIMLAASIWSLIIPAIEMSKKYGKLSCFPVTIGIIIGILFLFFMERKISKKLNTNLLNFAITLHNIPEGMAVGVVLASVLNGGNSQLLISAISMSIGIGIQNIPEGMAISLPSASKGTKKLKAFLEGVLSGIVEPIFGFLSLLISGWITKYLSVFLGIAAGSMMYVVIKELIPEVQDSKYSNIGIFSIMIGFLIMMILDVILG